jgi:hypothetical protein
MPLWSLRRSWRPPEDALVTPELTLILELSATGEAIGARVEVEVDVDLRYVRRLVRVGGQWTPAGRDNDPTWWRHGPVRGYLPPLDPPTREPERVSPSRSRRRKPGVRFEQDLLPRIGRLLADLQKANPERYDEVRQSGFTCPRPRRGRPPKIDLAEAERRHTAGETWEAIAYDANVRPENLHRLRKRVRARDL